MHSYATGQTTPFFAPPLFILLALAGCGTTTWTDTPRTATEQLLISTAVDQSVENIDFAPLSGQDVWIDSAYLDESVEQRYLISFLRQRMMVQGCVVKDKMSDAKYVVEVRAGAIGTDRHDRLIGIPATSMSMPVGPEMGMPSSIPEIALAKTTNQRGVASIACFAYDRTTGRALWQSGAVPVAVNAKHTWFVGAGPFKRGSLYDSTQFVEARRAKSDDTQTEATLGSLSPGSALPSSASPATVATQSAAPADRQQARP